MVHSKQRGSLYCCHWCGSFTVLPWYPTVFAYKVRRPDMHVLMEYPKAAPLLCPSFLLACSSGT